ncbi:MAG: DNA-3-methyladenine glycosylase family protein [Lachnospiraceae bacterium]
MSAAWFPYGDREISELSQKDPVLGRVMASMERPQRKLLPDLFSGLIFFILFQQISAKAAETEWARFQEMFSPIVPEQICRFSPETLQKAGTTLRRAWYIRSIAEQLARGEPDVDSLTGLDDAAFVREISRLPGVGVWTAEMLQIHVLKRPNVISDRDLAIRRGMCMVYQVPKISRDFFRQKQETYSPFATTASIYLWAISAGKGNI